MGREAECVVRSAEASGQRKVALESEALIVRGKPRIMIPFAQIVKVEARGGALHVQWAGGEVVLELGADAPKWEKDILHPRSRIDKLGVKAGQLIVLLSVDDAKLPGEITDAGARILRTAKDADLVFVQVDTASGLSRIARAAEMIAPAGGVWVVSPRGVAGLKDTDVMQAGLAAGLVDVKVVRFSSTHSANKFVIPVAKRGAAKKP